MRKYSYIEINAIREAIRCIHGLEYIRNFSSKLKSSEEIELELQTLLIGSVSTKSIAEYLYVKLNDYKNAIIDNVTFPVGEYNNVEDYYKYLLEIYGLDQFLNKFELWYNMCLEQG